MLGLREKQEPPLAAARKELKASLGLRGGGRKEEGKSKGGGGGQEKEGVGKRKVPQLNF